MGLKVISTGILMLLLTYNINGSPPRDSRDIHNKEIVGQASNIITAKLLKGSVESNKNTVFSPIGFAAILAILGEGASDDTNNDINTLLKHPDNRGIVRGAYRSVLSHLQGLDPQNAPQFRSWFYIYKNNTVEDGYKQILENDYYVTVRDVEPYNSDPELEEETTNSKVSDEKPSTKSTTGLAEVEAKSEGTPTNSKDIIEFDSFKMESAPVDETRIDTQKDASKFDEVVEDRQYVEVPVIKDTMKQTNKGDENDDKEVVKAEETKRMEPAIKAPVQDVKESKKSSLPLKQYEEMEIMQAEETRLGKSFGGKSGEGASIISGNSLIGEKENVTESESDRYEPKMLLFNGLYYHGNWATPFQHLRDESFENVFYTADDQKVAIKMMRARGYFKIGTIAKYDSQAIELPYDNIRYSMLLMVPQGADGLKKLITEFNANSLNDISNELQEELINVSLPKFEVQTTSGAEKVLAKEGLASLFTSKADFSGITKAQKIRVGELQQHVTLRVDESSSTENFLTATFALRTNANVNERSVAINRPFLFFVRDRIDDVTIIAGKITSLEAFAMDEPEIPK